MSQEETRRPMGALACLSTGFEIVARHPELIVLPLLMDLFLWLGPRLSIAPLLESAKAFFRQQVAGAAAFPEVGDRVALIVSVLDELSQGFNLFSALQPGPLFGVPVLMPLRTGTGYPLGERIVIQLSSFSTVVTWGALLTLLGLGLAALYLRLVGEHVIDETESPLPGPASTWTIWRQLLKLGLLLLVVMAGLILAVSLFSGVVGLLSPVLAMMIMLMASSTMLFAALHLLFAIPGMVQLRRSLLASLKESLLLTRGDFLGVMLLIGLIFIIYQGLNVVWTLPQLDSWAAVVGLGGHAFVSTALTAALLVFYQERLRFLEMLKELYTTRAKEANVRPVPGE